MLNTHRLVAHVCAGARVRVCALAQRPHPRPTAGLLGFACKSHSETALGGSNPHFVVFVFFFVVVST